MRLERGSYSVQTAPWGASRSCWRRARGNWGCVEAAAHTQTHGGAALYNSQGGAGQAHHNSPASDVAVLAPGAHKKRVCMRRGRCGGKTAVQSARRALRRRCRSNPGSDRPTSRQRLSGLQPAEAHVERNSTPRRVVAEARQVPTAGRRGKKAHGGAAHDESSGHNRANTELTHLSRRRRLDSEDTNA